MSSIASLSGGGSPLDRLQSLLERNVVNGTIAASDESALSSALEDIDNALMSGASSSGRTAPPSPDEMKAKVDSLIDEQVSSGQLTTEQAAELKELFESARPPGGPGGSGGAAPRFDGQDSETAALDALLKALQSQQSSNSYGSDGNRNSSNQSLLFNFSA